MLRYRNPSPFGVYLTAAAEATSTVNPKSLQTILRGFLYSQGGLCQLSILPTLGPSAYRQISWETSLAHSLRCWSRFSPQCRSLIKDPHPAQCWILSSHLLLSFSTVCWLSLALAPLGPWFLEPCFCFPACTALSQVLFCRAPSLVQSPYGPIRLPTRFSYLLLPAATIPLFGKTRNVTVIAVHGFVVFSCVIEESQVACASFRIGINLPLRPEAPYCLYLILSLLTSLCSCVVVL